MTRVFNLKYIYLPEGIIEDFENFIAKNNKVYATFFREEVMLILWQIQKVARFNAKNLRSRPFICDVEGFIGLTNLKTKLTPNFKSILKALLWSKVINSSCVETADLPFKNKSNPTYCFSLKYYSRPTVEYKMPDVYCKDALMLTTKNAARNEGEDEVIKTMLDHNELNVNKAIEYIKEEFEASFQYKGSLIQTCREIESGNLWARSTYSDPLFNIYDTLPPWVQNNCVSEIDPEDEELSDEEWNEFLRTERLRFEKEKALHNFTYNVDDYFNGNKERFRNERRADIERAREARASLQACSQHAGQ